METGEKQEVFWADQIARKIISRPNYRYLDRPVPAFSEYVVKTSASISGVLHIGRLSDTIRGASVYRALKDAGVKSRLIWVAEDMDPLRKIPEGVPSTYEKYIGAPVSTIPDPQGCHASYADHHTDEYFKVLHKFTFEEMEKFSMQAEYRKGSFNEFIKTILGKIDLVKEIQNKYRTNPLKKEWSPWNPVCVNCGKIVTPRIRSTEDGKLLYVCKDYAFESMVATGCGHKGEADPLKDPGKLVWKSEWAAQWAKWKISTEGAGKEYQVPNSAFWINAEIVERVLEFPAPEPIFYEHIMVDGVKMSASLGNVIYPRDWLEVATPQILRFFYNKRLMMTRSFSWKELPQLYDEYDDASAVYWGNTKLENEKEANHIRRMYDISNKQGEPQKALAMPFVHAAMLAQTFAFGDNQSIIASLNKTKHYSADVEKELLERIALASAWVKHHAPPEYKFEVQEHVSDPIKASLSSEQKKVLKLFAQLVSQRSWEEKELSNEAYELCKREGVKSKDFFRAAYLVLLGKEQGPRLVPFVLSLEERAVKLFEEAGF